METILYRWHLELATWVYLSSILAIAIYFKFNRFWSVRNLDLMLLVALAPGLLLVQDGADGGPAELTGYVWLFVVGGLFLLRLLIDPSMVRRPLLEPNLSTGGLTFLGTCLLVFLMINVLSKNPTELDLEGVRRFEQLAAGEAVTDPEWLARYGPGYPLLHALPSLSTKAMINLDASLPEEAARLQAQIATTKTTAILAHLAVVMGMVLAGVLHFDNIRTGIAAATLYLMLPYTAAMTGYVSHVLPAALLTWALVAYRRPMIAGALLGLATGVIYFPLFLLPLWLGFYWRRGVARFAIGYAITLGLVIGSLAFTSRDLSGFLAQVKLMSGWTALTLDGTAGFWLITDVAWPYRIPVMVAFLAMAAGMAVWPSPKNLGTLISCSAAVMLGTQFWHPHQGGLYMAWYLPALVLTVFRPNLEDRVTVASPVLSWNIRRWQPGTRAA